ncbi:Crp/Fnr family transcriptional regulator [Flavobacterium faecale]|uniref:Crp/Fnr family transcriptional regulator n=1 Tax=Flavobacterium faecale TaxID=1355330 RepID=A0A2S1LG85_9FLAO|nr:ThuA domain-containing protein [Flavobacterium faecale]AWG22747.1 Crp/Fnr family transcriptional regulator [Flavobacterium faecale]
MKQTKKNHFTVLTALLALVFVFSTGTSFAKKSNKVLIFSKTAKFHHQSIPAGIKAIMKLGEENGFKTDTTTNSKNFNKENLKQYAAVIFLSPTGDVLNEEQQQAFEQYIKSGGGFMGVHAATDCEYDWAWYGNLVGAYFSSHPKQQEAVLKVSDRKHISTKHLPADWKRKDEWYNFKWMAPDLKVLVSIDETSYDAGKGKMGANHPMAWYHNFDGGRAFYTELGHTDESYKEPLFLQHLLGGIKYAMGKSK